jgi:hypothetical protein
MRRSYAAPEDVRYLAYAIASGVRDERRKGDLPQVPAFVIG